MNLTAYDPWKSLQSVHNDLDQLFRNWSNYNVDDDSTHVMSMWSPSVDIRNEEGHYALNVDIPGVDPKDIDLTMENGVLTIQGERKTHNEEEGKNYLRTERVQGNFYRRFSLPDTVDGEGVKANANNGVLEIIIPKQEKAKPKRISVSS